VFCILCFVFVFCICVLYLCFVFVLAMFVLVPVLVHVIASITSIFEISLTVKTYSNSRRGYREVEGIINREHVHNHGKGNRIEGPLNLTKSRH
jgi:hypothetical protein